MTLHAVIGTGRLSQALVPALRAVGAAVVVGSRAGPVLPAEAAAQGDWVWVLVPDDAIASTAAALPWRPSQLGLHASGATPLSALSAAPAAAGFHPLRLLAGGAVGLAGAHVGIEADGQHRHALEALAVQLGLVPLSLPHGMSGAQRAAYHAAANLAASGVLAVLAEAEDLWRAAGLAAEAALPALAPLTRGALDTALARSLAAAVSGPVARGDLEVLARHRAAVAAAGLDAGLWRGLAQRQLALAEADGRLDAVQLAALRAWLASVD